MNSSGRYDVTPRNVADPLQKFVYVDGSLKAFASDRCMEFNDIRKRPFTRSCPHPLAINIITN